MDLQRLANRRLLAANLALLAFFGAFTVGTVSQLKVPPAWLALLGFITVDPYAASDVRGDWVAFASSSVPTIGLAVLALVRLRRL